MPSFKIFLGALFALLTVAMCVLAVTTYNLNQTTTETWKWLHHSREVLDQIDQVASDFKAVQLESNAVSLTADSAALNRYRVSRASIEEGMRNLHALTRDNSEQQARVQTMDRQLARLVNFTDSVVNNPVRISSAALLQRITVNTGFRQAIQDEIKHLRAVENRILRERQSRNIVSRDNFNRVLLLMLTSVFGLIASAFIVMRYNFNRLLRTELKLTKAHELFFHVFDDSPIAMFITHPENGVIIDCNLRFAQLVNRKREQIIDKSIDALHLFENDTPARLFAVDTAVEVRLLRGDLEPAWVSVSSQQIHLKDNDCVLTAMIDITERKNAESEIVKSLEKEMELNALKSNFVTLASHEFRTPLTTILSSTILLESYLPVENKDKVSRHISRIKSAVGNLTGILDEFLSVSKIEEGKVEPRREKVNVEEFIRAIVRNIKSIAKQGQSITFTHKGPAEVDTDPAILMHVINNLLSNAVKYSPESAGIDVTSEVGTTLVIRIADTGIGIPPQDEPHLFERFYRASNAGQAPGTGLGLHITKHYVELLHGTIGYVSTLGKGTTFNVSIPIDGPLQVAGHRMISEKYQQGG